MKRSSYLAALLCVCLAAAQAAEVHGEITLDPRMTRKAVPPAVYDLRGMALHDKQMPKEHGAGASGALPSGS